MFWYLQIFGFVKDSTLDPNVKEITIIVKEITWVKRERHHARPLPPTNMGTMSASDPQLSILEGPWEFKITL